MRQTCLIRENEICANALKLDKQLTGSYTPHIELTRAKKQSDE